MISASGFRTCIFLDGLDECENDTRRQLVSDLIELVNSTSVKLCVSSRPWNDFKRGFSLWPRLKLPENNDWDIFQLVCKKLAWAERLTFQDCGNDMNLFEIICARRRPTQQYYEESDSLESPRRLILDLCKKADGNMLWITAVLDPIRERLAAGQTLATLSQHIEGLPQNVEDYYHQLVYSRIHSTYRADGRSECAMALKICVESDDDQDRYLAMWMLQQSVDARNGVANDPEFASNFAYPDCAIADSKQAYTFVLDFVDSRCRDFFVMQHRDLSSFTNDKKGSTLAFQHRVIFDFVTSARMRSEIDLHTPQHFRTPLFKLQVVVVTAKLMLGRQKALDLLASPDPYRNELSRSMDMLRWRLRLDMGHLYCSPDEPVVKTCDELACVALSIFLQFRLHDARGRFHAGAHWISEIMPLLAQVNQFAFISDVIGMVSQQPSDLANPVCLHPVEIANSVFRMRRLCKSNGGFTRNTENYYIPCRLGHWMWLLRHFSLRVGWIARQNQELFLSFKRAVKYVSTAFIEAGADTDVESCFELIPGESSDCHGPRCVCPDPRTHAGLYECPMFLSKSSHKHNWISAKDVLLNHQILSEAELTHLLATRQNHTRLAEEEYLRLSDDIDTEWRRFVEQCVLNNRSITKPHLQGSWPRPNFDEIE